MRIAFDFDGTLTLDEDRMVPLARSLMAQGHKMFLLSVVQNPEEAERKAQFLFDNGLSDFTPSFVQAYGEGDYKECAEIKPQRCRDLGIDVFFEDNDIVIKGVHSISPDTVIVKPSKGSA
ncbi:hypothetical protein LCGC14_3125860 [marine sediment metagenome]|uniref:Uncharacterized protein n=1 Tax=marine sediment metagenome TaxID=412755 RepID=A0A0F8WPX4_9ZZZZ